MSTEAVAKWMIVRGYATGHGDTIEDLLKELEWQIRESEREAVLDLVDDYAKSNTDLRDAIRARGNKK